MNEGLKEGERLRVKKSFYIIKSIKTLSLAGFFVII